MNYELRKLSINDDREIYDMLQEISKEENGFMNSLNGKTFQEFKQWLIASEEFSKSQGLQGWKVPTTIYWLYVDGQPVGFGKLRHFLTEQLLEEGGNVGYAIRPSERKKGFGSILLKMIIEEAKKMNIKKLLLTIRNHNHSSIKVALNNNGKIEKSNEERSYIWIDC